MLKRFDKKQDSYNSIMLLSTLFSLGNKQKIKKKENKKMFWQLLISHHTCISCHKLFNAEFLQMTIWATVCLYSTQYISWLLQLFVSLNAQVSFQFYAYLFYQWFSIPAFWGMLNTDWCKGVTKSTRICAIINQSIK